MDSDEADHHHNQVGDHDPETEQPSSCSICFEVVLDNGTRSFAKLRCGHRFHLDCIGSAFNMKGAMQCPNCRNVEDGQWLFANGSNRNLPELSMDDWIPDEDFDDLSYSDMPYRFQWCPFGVEGGAASPFEEVESPLITYHDFSRHHSNHVEPIAASSLTRSLVEYDGQTRPATSRSSDSIEEPGLSHRWYGLSGCDEIFNPHTFPTLNIQYHAWGSGHHMPPFSRYGGQINGVDPASAPPFSMRSYNSASDSRTRAASFPWQIPYVNGSGLVVGSTLPGVGRFNSPTGFSLIAPAPPQCDQSGILITMPPAASSQNPHETGYPFPNHFHAQESEHTSCFYHATYGGHPSWVSFHQNTSGSDYSSSSISFWHPS